MTGGFIAMTTSKIRIKLGAIEVEYEGSEAFLKEELPRLLGAVSDLHAKSGGSSTSHSDLGQGESGGSATGGKKIEATTASIAARLQAKSGPELIMAAVARITFALGQDVCSRQKISQEMKSAASYYKKTYMNNLSKYLDVLVKDNKLNEPSSGNYALTASARADMESRIA